MVFVVLFEMLIERIKSLRQSQKGPRRAISLRCGMVLFCRSVHSGGYDLLFYRALAMTMISLLVFSVSLIASGGIPARSIEFSFHYRGDEIIVLICSLSSCAVSRQLGQKLKKYTTSILLKKLYVGALVCCLTRG